MFVFNVCAKALTLDVEVPAGLTTGVGLVSSLSLVYYSIYNPSTANSFRPMGAL